MGYEIQITWLNIIRLASVRLLAGGVGRQRRTDNSVEVSLFSVQNRTIRGVEIWVGTVSDETDVLLVQRKFGRSGIGAKFGNRFSFNRLVGSIRRHQFWWASLSLVTKHLGQTLKNS